MTEKLEIYELSYGIESLAYSHYVAKEMLIKEVSQLISEGYKLISIEFQRIITPMDVVAEYQVGGHG